MLFRQNWAKVSVHASVEGSKTVVSHRVSAVCLFLLGILKKNNSNQNIVHEIRLVQADV